MNLLKRIFNLGKSEAHSIVDSLENPIKMTEQGIRNLKSDLNDALKGLAEIKALAIRARNDFNTAKLRAKDYEGKAVLLLKKAEKGEIEVADAERLATEALVKKDENSKIMEQERANKEKFEANTSQMQRKINQLKRQIATFENELKTLKARVKVSTATKNINRQMANIDSSSTVSMLERMKDKVAQDEAMSEAYAEVADEGKSLDEEIDKVLEGNSSIKASSDLEELKAKLGMSK